MPIYEYSCRDCGAQFEKLVAGQVAVSCPSCQSGGVIRRISLVGVKTGSRAGDASAPMSGACCGGGCGCH